MTNKVTRKFRGDRAVVGNKPCASFEGSEFKLQIDYLSPRKQVCRLPMVSPGQKMGLLVAGRQIQCSNVRLGRYFRG